MEADARTLLTLVAPIAIMYMTYSSVSATAAANGGNDLKSVSVGQIGIAPRLPSADGTHRNPFVPRSGSGGGEPVADAAADANAEKTDQPLHLDGTVIAGKARFAIINGQRVTEGDYFRRMRLTKVETTQVTLTGESEQVVLPLEIAKSDSIHAPATIVSGSHAPSRPSAARAPSESSSATTSNVASKDEPRKHEPPKSVGATGVSVLGGTNAKPKPSASKTKSGSR